MAPFLGFGRKKKSKTKEVGENTESQGPFKAGFVDEQQGYTLRDGYMKPAYPERQLSNFHVGTLSGVDGPTPEDYGRWNDASTVASKHGQLQEREGVSSFSRSFAPDYAASVNDHAPPRFDLHGHPNPFSLYPQQPPWSGKNKLRRRALSSPSAPITSVTTSVKGEDPLKRMKYDLQITTFLLNKLKLSTAGRRAGGMHAAASPLAPSSWPNIVYGHPTVDPRKLVDPYIDGRHGTEFHQIHNHGLLLHPYYYAPSATSAAHYPQNYPVHLQQKYQPPMGHQKRKDHRSTVDQGNRDKDKSSRRASEIPPAVEVRAKHESRPEDPRRKRYASDAPTPSSYPHAPPVASSFSAPPGTSSRSKSKSEGQKRDGDTKKRDRGRERERERGREEAPVFGNFRQPSYAVSQPPSQHSKRRSMPAALRPELIMAIEGDNFIGGPDLNRDGTRKVRFRGADSVIGSPAPLRVVAGSVLPPVGEH